MVDLQKYQLSTHVYSHPLEAKASSVDMGFNGAIHVHDVDGQAYYMPGATHMEYLEAMGYDAPEPVTEDRMVEALRAVVAEIMNKSEDMNIEGQVLKADEEQRMVYGWASVITEKGEPVVDRQGDVIKADTLVKAVNDFMEHVRVGKEMHSGNQIGVVVHSWPVTDDIAKSVGISSDREGWLVAFKVYDDDVWAKVKNGELAAFSIGGRATKEAYHA